VAPTAQITGDANVDEGTTHTYTFTVTDPGQDTFTVNGGYPTCGDHGTLVGTPTVTASGGSFQCNFPAGPNTTNVAIRVTDSDGASDTASESVRVVDIANVPPSITAPADQTTDEGSSQSFNLGSFTDPGADSPWTVTVDWGDGSFPATTITMDSPGTIPAQSHTYADGPSDPSVTVSVYDGFQTTSKTFKVHANNVAPTVAFSSAPTSANEGETKHYSYSIADPGQDTVQSAATSCGSSGMKSNATNSDSGGSFDCSFPDGDAGSTVSVQATDSDGDAGNTASQDVSIANVAPTIAISGKANVDEGSPYSVTLGAVNDPGQDTVSSYVVHWGDGSSDSYGTTGVKTHTYADGPSDHNITVDLVDEDSTFLDAANALAVHVANGVPSTPSLVSPADNATTNNNKPAFDWGDSSDPAGANDTITYRIQVDDNCDFSSPAIDQTTSSSNFTPGSALADGTYCWRVSASDEDGGTSAYSSVRHITIDAKSPTVVSITRADANPTNASSVNWTVKFSEGVSGVDASDFALAGSGLGGSPAVAGVSGSGDTYTVTSSTGAGSGTLGLNLVDEDSISDGAGNSLGGNGAGNGSFTGEVYTIDRSAPTVTINQGATQSDPATTAPIHFTAVFSEPVSDFTNTDVTLSGCSGAIANVYDMNQASPDHMTYDIRVNGMPSTTCTVTATISVNKAIDGAGNGNAASTSADNSVTWQPAANNTTPVVTVISPTFGSVYAKGSASINPLTVKASFTDPDNGPWTYTINWDDGNAVSTGSASPAPSTFQATHSYLNPGVYTINVCVKDATGANGCASVWVVVYDPNGGFVTGGGWLNVGPGSYRADQTLYGRANFGFNSQYKKNANVPTGETEFNFQVGNFNFHASVYQWLVVSGFKSQYKGTGTVNGGGSYDFTLTAYDGDLMNPVGPDKFRIRISDNNNSNAVVFDNKYGTPTDIDAADPQVIAGGSIVIHKA
jgi:hypothetical protein